MGNTLFVHLCKMLCKLWLKSVKGVYKKSTYTNASMQMYAYSHTYTHKPHCKPFPKWLIILVSSVFGCMTWITWKGKDFQRASKNFHRFLTILFFKMFQAGYSKIGTVQIICLPGNLYVQKPTCLDTCMYCKNISGCQHMYVYSSVYIHASVYPYIINTHMCNMLIH